MKIHFLSYLPASWRISLQWWNGAEIQSLVGDNDKKSKPGESSRRSFLDLNERAD